MILLYALGAHFIGDYLLQTHYMAEEKTKRWIPAILHGIAYTIPFLFLTSSPLALLVITGTHIVIDRYRLARYVIWFKNQFAPLSHRPRWDRPAPTDWVEDGSYFGTGDPNLLEGHPARKGDLYFDVKDQLTWKHDGLIWGCLQPHPEGTVYADKTTGYLESTPKWLSVWLMIVTDNLIHILINAFALTYLN